MPIESASSRSDSANQIGRIVYGAPDTKHTTMRPIGNCTSAGLAWCVGVCVCELYVSV